MNTGADVRSLEALEGWYSALALFRAEGQAAMTSLALALQNAHHWLDDQLAYWQRAVRQAEEHVSEARIELRNREFQSFTGEKPDTTVHEQELRRARGELEHAEDRVASVRRWKLKLPVVIEDVYLGPARNMEFLLEATLIRALSQLDQQMRALEQYLGVKPAARPVHKEIS